MSRILFANNATTTLAGAITNVATTAALQTGAGALFPAPSTGQYFCMTFVDAATGLLNEIVHVTNVTGDVITMVRGQEGTTALSWLSGDHASNWITAAALAAMAQAPDTQAQAGNYVADTSSTVNTITAALSPTLTAYVAGLPMRIKLANTNTSATVVINVNGVGNLNVITPGGGAPAIGSLAAGTIATFTYDGTNAQVSSGLASVTSTGAQVYLGSSGGTANVQTFTPSPSISTYTTGSVEYVGIASYTNTGSMTVNISGIGAVNVYKETQNGNVALTGGEWVAGNIVVMRYNGSQMTLLNPVVFNAYNVWPGQQTGNVVSLTYGSTVNWDLNPGQTAQLVLAGSPTLAVPSNQVAGGYYTLRLVQPSSGGPDSIAFNSAYKGVSGVVLSTANNAVDHLCFRSNGSNMELVGSAFNCGL